MPTYQYACTVCAEQLEAVQKFTDAPLTECPACGGALRKVFSPVGVVFKGSGFYKTDSRSSSASKRSSEPAAASSSSSSDSSGSSASSDTGSASTGSSSAGSSAPAPAGGATAAAS